MASSRETTTATTTTSSLFSALPKDIVWSIADRLLSQSPANPGQQPLPPATSLSDLVHVSLLDDRVQQIMANIVAKKWRGVSRLDGPAPSMLKLFECKYQLEVYQQLVIDGLQLDAQDARLRLNNYAWEQHFWRHQDHLCLDDFTNTPIDVLINALAALFDYCPGRKGKVGRITALVVGTCGLHLNLVDLLKAFPAVDSLTLFEMPESEAVQAELWTYLATRSNHQPLKQLHIIHRNGLQPISARQMAPAINSHLQALTLSQYTAASNQAQLLNAALNGNACRQVLLFENSPISADASYDSHWMKFRTRWERSRWWEEDRMLRRQELIEVRNFEMIHSESKYQLRLAELKFMLGEAAFRRHWTPRALLTMVERERAGRPLLNLSEEDDQMDENSPLRFTDSVLMQGARWIDLDDVSPAVRNALWNDGGPPFVPVPGGYRDEDHWMAERGHVLLTPLTGLLREVLGQLWDDAPNEWIYTQMLVVIAPRHHQLKKKKKEKEEVQLEEKDEDQDKDDESDIANESPFSLTTVQIITVTVWLKKMACLVGFGAAPTVVPYISERDFLSLLYPLQPPKKQSTVIDPHRKLQQLAHLWRALIRKLNQMVAKWVQKEKEKQKKTESSDKTIGGEKDQKVLITKSELFSLFIELYHRLFTGQWQPPLPFYYHSPNATEVDPLKPWIVIWTLIHNSFELDNDNDGNLSAEIPFFPNTPDYLTTVNGKCVKIAL